MLELGCGDGGNLAPIAAGLPGGRFAGIDAAPGAIAAARALAAGAGLANVRFDAVAIERFEPPPGGFDYVIAHGVYSWVEPAVRDRLLAVCERALAPGGVAYVSYNALPGSHMRQALREMLRFHTAAERDPHTRVARARELLRLLLAEWPAEQPLRRPAEELLARADASVLHDDLADVNDPVYFHEFAAHAAMHGLQYLAEADFFEMQIGVLSGAVADALQQLSDVVRREQYLDFVKGRMFRQTLLCRADEPVDRQPRADVIQALAVSTPAVRSGDEKATVFEGPTGSRLTTDHPEVIAALERVTAAWPAAIPVRDLGSSTALAEALLRGYAANLLQLHTRPRPIATRAGDRPTVCPLARRQARAGELVTNLHHRAVRLEDDRGRRLVTLLDGTRDRAALAEALDVEHDLDGLERSLAALARLALLTD